ncbi:HlyD family secretion protein [Chitinimonas sp.]|uniref:HlyD family secretion protein n=1 Tax=Chitinimonas sp. TaxID=1934313 RepID=UPI0035B17CD0
MRVDWMMVALCAALAGCGDKPVAVLHGYVEAEPVRVASPVGGVLVQLAVERGEAVKAGQPLFTLEHDSEQAALNEAGAKLAQARAQASDLDSGKRPQELAVIQAQQAAAAAALRQSEADLQRQRELVQAGFAARATLDAITARRDADAARSAELQAQLRSNQLAARDDSRSAARAGAAAAEAQLAQRQWVLAQKAVKAPLAARVDDRYYRVGEWVPAGAPVLSLTATGAVKARFYIPEPWLPKLAPGAKVSLRCDGCGAPMAATVRFVARDAEYTPPLIYSKENRSKLVWLAEAVPDAADAARLRPGQPLDVLPAVQP